MSQIIGHISQVIGPVVDVYFEGKGIDTDLPFEQYGTYAFIEELLMRIAYRREIGDDLAEGDRKSTRLNSSHLKLSRMPSSA